MSRSKKRLKPNHEIIRQVRKQPKAIRNCSFCKGINHRKTNCPKLGEYRARYKEIFDNQHHEYIEFLKQTAPIMHPNDIITVYSEVLSKNHQHHLIIHKEIYAKIKSHNCSYGFLNMNQILFTISIISMKNASTSVTRFLELIVLK